MRLELTCNQLLFLQGISLRRYTPVLCWKGQIRTAVPAREQSYSLPVLTTHPPSSNVIREGFEPSTDSLEGCCSIQLSYRTFVHTKVYIFKGSPYDETPVSAIISYGQTCVQDFTFSPLMYVKERFLLCTRPESNRHDHHWSRDFKSLVSTYFTTGASLRL